MSRGTKSADPEAIVPMVGAHERVLYTGPERRRTSQPGAVEPRRALTVMAVAGRLSVHRDTVYALLRAGKLRHARIGTRSYRIDSESVDAYLAALFADPVGDAAQAEAPTRRVAFDADDYLPPVPKVFG